MQKQPQKHYFRSIKFFSSEFPFSIIRYTHTPAEYDESVRCQREFWKIIYVISGSGSKIINNQRYPIKPGSLFFIHPEDETTYSIDSDKIEIYNIIFMPKLISREINNLRSDFNFFSIFGDEFREISGVDRQMLYVLDSDREVERIIRRMEKEFVNEAPNYQNMIRLYLQALIILASRLSSNKMRGDRNNNIANYIDHLIDRHFSENFNFPNLAAEIGITQSHLCRIYKNIRHCTITQALLERRLEEAEKLLHRHKFNITELCFDCGFNNISYFYRAFHQKYGMNPGDYRKTFTLH